MPKHRGWCREFREAHTLVESRTIWKLGCSASMLTRNAHRIVLKNRARSRPQGLIGDHPPGITRESIFVRRQLKSEASKAVGRVTYDSSVAAERQLCTLATHFLLKARSLTL